MENSQTSSFLHIRLTAALFVVTLCGVAFWQVVHPNASPAAATQNTAEVTPPPSQSQLASADSATQAATDTDPVAAVSTNALGEVIGAYAGLQQEGTYSPDAGSQIANSIGQGLQTPIAYHIYTAADVVIDPDTSYGRVMKYKADLQTTMKPLMQHTEPEYEIFGLYVETHQQTYLDKLAAAAQGYRDAASSTAALTVPADAVHVQLGLINSMNEFASVLDALVAHADDPIASSVLLENYNQSESDVLNAFNALIMYEKSKAQ